MYSPVEESSTMQNPSTKSKKFSTDNQVQTMYTSCTCGRKYKHSNTVAYRAIHDIVFHRLIWQV